MTDSRRKRQEGLASGFPTQDILSHEAFPELLRAAHNYRHAMLRQQGGVERHLQAAEEYRAQYGVEAVIPFGQRADLDDFMQQVIGDMNQLARQLSDINVREAEYLENLKGTMSSPDVWQKPRSTVQAQSSRSSKHSERDSSASSSGVDHLKVNQGGHRVAFRRDVTDTLTAWFLEHQHHPYPTVSQKAELSKQTGLSPSQIQCWFTNIRKRHWAPVVQNKRQPRTFLEVLLHAGSKAKGDDDSKRKLAAKVYSPDHAPQATQQRLAGSLNCPEQSPKEAETAATPDARSVQSASASLPQLPRKKLLTSEGQLQATKVHGGQSSTLPSQSNSQPPRRSGGVVSDFDTPFSSALGKRSSEHLSNSAGPLKLNRASSILEGAEILMQVTRTPDPPANLAQISNAEDRVLLSAKDSRRSRVNASEALQTVPSVSLPILSPADRRVVRGLSMQTQMRLIRSPQNSPSSSRARQGSSWEREHRELLNEELSMPAAVDEFPAMLPVTDETWHSSLMVGTDPLPLDESISCIIQGGLMDAVSSSTELRQLTPSPIPIAGAAGHFEGVDDHDTDMIGIGTDFFDFDQGET